MLIADPQWSPGLQCSGGYSLNNVFHAVQKQSSRRFIQTFQNKKTQSKRNQKKFFKTLRINSEIKIKVVWKKDSNQTFPGLICLGLFCRIWKILWQNPHQANCPSEASGFFPHFLAAAASPCFRILCWVRPRYTTVNAAVSPSCPVRNWAHSQTQVCCSGGPHFSCCITECLQPAPPRPANLTSLVCQTFSIRVRH